MQPAGFDTWHIGTGACEKHDKTADHSKKNRRQHQSAMGNRLKSAINEYLTKDKISLMDLTKELAATRAIMDYMLETFDPENEEFKFDVWIRHFTNAIGALSNLVERISRVDNRNALTAAEVLFIKATMVDLFMKYIPDPVAREQAAKELANRIGGNVDAKIYPNEIKRLGT